MVSNKKVMRYLAVAVILFIVLFWVPTPYVIIQPGKVEVVHGMVHIEESYPDQSGSLMLTTVQLSYSNVAAFIMANFDKYANIYLKKDFFQGQTSQEYSERQAFYMETSQSDAIQAAYAKAKIPFNIVTSEVRVIGTIDDMPADGVLEVGDHIVKIDDAVIEDSEHIMTLMKAKNVGEDIEITFKRGGNTGKVTLKVGKTKEGQQAIGMYLANIQSVQPAEKGKDVRITAGAIGGPSAGLIFALEIYDRLMPEDITKGYQIAGTGEINPQGQVGEIGGIEFKIVAADKAGADIFFTPEGNAAAAIQTGQDIRSTMQIVEVKTLNDALAYLDALPVK